MGHQLTGLLDVGHAAVSIYLFQARKADKRQKSICNQQIGLNMRYFELMFVTMYLAFAFS